VTAFGESGLCTDSVIATALSICCKLHAWVHVDETGSGIGPDYRAIDCGLHLFDFGLSHILGVHQAEGHDAGQHDTQVNSHILFPF